MSEEMIEIPKRLLVDLVHLRNKDKRAYMKAGSPNHSHQVPGVWDSDNGVFSNKPCAECAIYDEAQRILNEEPGDDFKHDESCPLFKSCGDANEEHF